MTYLNITPTRPTAPEHARWSLAAGLTSAQCIAPCRHRNHWAAAWNSECAARDTWLHRGELKEWVDMGRSKEVKWPCFLRRMAIMLHVVNCRTWGMLNPRTKHGKNEKIWIDPSTLEQPTGYCSKITGVHVHSKWFGWLMGLPTSLNMTISIS
jgi:hypothetical protein